MNTATETKVEIGDIVILKTGSIEMVLDEYLADERVLCKWSDEGVFQSAEFSIYSLTKA
jgi:uncharacterized protein YodC (DUF2158 family)